MYSYLNVRKPNDHCKCIAKLDNWPDISERALSIWPIEFMFPEVRKRCNKVSRFLLNCKSEEEKNWHMLNFVRDYKYSPWNKDD